MQRLLVILTVIVLVAASLGVGTLAAHWPFWRRAWQWHEAGQGQWPAALSGPRQQIHGGSSARPLQFRDDAQLAAVAAQARTELLLRASLDGRAAAWLAPGFTPEGIVDGGDLTSMALLPLYAVLAAERPGLLDAPIAAWIQDWREDRRGPITPRQLFWQLSGFPQGRAHPLNPFGASAQLASGPDFSRAALRWRAAWPPGSHFEESAVNAQLLALVASRLAGERFADLLQRRVWSRVAADDAALLLDHRRGAAAAHCCLQASAADWLRMALLLAADGRHGQETLWTPGFLGEVLKSSPVHDDYGLGFELLHTAEGRRLLALGSRGRRLLIAPESGVALLWTGSGEPPAGLAKLLDSL